MGPVGFARAEAKWPCCLSPPSLTPPPTEIGVTRAVGQREEVLEWGTLVAGPGSGRGSLSQMVRASFASNLNPHTWTRAFSLVVLGHSHPHLPPSRNERGPGLHLLMRTEVGAWVSSPHPFFLGEIMLKICLLTLPWSWDRAPVNVGGGEGSRA